MKKRHDAEQIMVKLDATRQGLERRCLLQAGQTDRAREPTRILLTFETRGTTLVPSGRSWTSPHQSTRVQGSAKPFHNFGANLAKAVLVGATLRDATWWKPICRNLACQKQTPREQP
jgi:hypothetical protein